MNEDPDLRPTAKELLSDPFFKGLDKVDDRGALTRVTSPTKRGKMVRSPVKGAPFRDITNITRSDILC